MTVAEFKQELETFLRDLEEHHRLWGKSLDDTIPDSPIRNTDELREQSLRLSRHLGRLRPYIHPFMPNWTMSIQATGTRWDALDAAVSTNAISQIKGPSLRSVTERLHQLLGTLDLKPANEDVAPTSVPASAATRANPAPLTLPSATSTSVNSASPSPATSHAPPEPVTLEKVALRTLLSALGTFSVGAWLTILTVLGGLIGAAITVTRWTDQRTIDALRDSVHLQQRSLDSLRARSDSVAAVLRRLRPK